VSRDFPLEHVDDCNGLIHRHEEWREYLILALPQGLPRHKDSGGFPGALRRCYLPCVPLYFVGVAFCVDAVIKVLKIERFQGFIVAGCVLCLCWPNYLAPRPNLKVNVVHQVAPMVKAHPVVAAWWTDSAVILGLRGQRTPLGLANGIQAADITDGRIDILLIDNNFRSSRTWADRPAFFESFEGDPPQFGFRKLTGVATGRFDVYYRPVAPPDRGAP